MISVLIADDAAFYREAIRSLLNDAPDIKVLWEVSNGKEVMDISAVHQIDVILLDIEMPIMDGIEVCEKLKAHKPEIKILILTQYSEEEFIIELMGTGANGYLIKHQTNKEEIVAAIKMVHTNGFYFNDQVSRTLLKAINKQKSIPATFKKGIVLKDIEVEVLQYICQEKTSKEIGEELFRSRRTIEDIRQNLMQKIGAKSVVGLVIYAIKEGLC